MKKILLIGDSIRGGYDKYVKMAFDGEAEVYYPAENCRFAAYIVRYLYDWKSKLGCGDDVDLVHFNVGLWDDLILLDGKPLTSLPVYCEYLDRIFGMIKIFFPKAKVIFATSTPVQEELFTREKRYNRDTELYNAEAVKIAAAHGAEINDLYTLTANAPVEYHSDLTHFYTKEGTELITNQVISVIEKALDIKAKALDYEALFTKKEDFIGV